MGGKGRRRREKNYLAAHGGHSRLPPPPNPSQVDAIPFKLRKIISFTSNAPLLHRQPPDSTLHNRGKHRHDDAANKKLSPEDANVEGCDGDDNGESDSRDGKREKKRKRKEVNDLRFEALAKTSEKKRERRKKLLEKKKKKCRTSEAADRLEFPGREQIKFGDVVQAPPKLAAVPKVFKNVGDASQERIRLKAIEAYRKRKGWSSRPGLQLATLTAPPSL